MSFFNWSQKRIDRRTENALAEAGQLADAGKFTDAIELLNAANRRQRDVRIEQHLINTRSDAFEAGVWSDTLPQWPETVDDLFVGELIPEIDSTDLTVEALRSAVEHHGSLIVRGLLDPATVDRLVVDIDAAMDAFDSMADGTERPDLAGWYKRFVRDQASNREGKRSRGSVMTVESPTTMFDLMEAFESVGLGQLVRDYFGEPPMLLARKGTLRRIAHEGNNGGWHQDGAFMGADIRSINIWLPLTHCGDTAPGIDIVGRRLDYIVQTGVGAFSEWATSPAAAEKVAEGVLVRPIFDPGDALLFDHLNLHRTAIDPGMTIDRHAIETWLMSPSSYGAMTQAVDGEYTPRDQVPILF